MPTMITFPCESCRRPLEVDDDLAGAKAACPHCGGVSTVPERAIRADGVAVARPAGGHGNSVASQQAKDRAAAKGLPPDSGPEQLVMKLHPVMFRAKPLVGALISLLVLGGVGGAITLSVFALFVPAIACLAAAGVGAAWWGVWKISAMTETLIITNKRTTLQRGLLSRSTREVLHDRVQDIQITQTILQRMLRVGTIGISSSGESDVEIVAEGMPGPLSIRDTIDAYREIG